jgi:hypothetical protein
MRPTAALIHALCGMNHMQTCCASATAAFQFAASIAMWGSSRDTPEAGEMA